MLWKCFYGMPLYEIEPRTWKKMESSRERSKELAFSDSDTISSNSPEVKELLVIGKSPSP